MSDKSVKSPLFKRLAAARLALKWVTSIMIASDSPTLPANSAKMRLNMPEPGPANEPVVYGLVRTLALGSIAPHQPMFDDLDDARQNSLAAYPQNALRQMNKLIDPAHLLPAQ